jgi:hypothetical protein
MRKGIIGNTFILIRLSLTRRIAINRMAIIRAAITSTDTTPVGIIDMTITGIITGIMGGIQ